jgi:Ca2+-binding RTX toxin-like protein
LQSEVFESRLLLTSLAGTSGNDSFVLTYSSTAASGLVNATLSSNGGVAVNLGTFSMDAGIELNGMGGTDSVRIVGTTGNDTFLAAASGWMINGSELEMVSIESATMVGGAGNDRYRFDADASLGSVRLEETGSGTDTIDLGLTTTQSVAVNLDLTTSQVVNSNLSLTLNSRTAFENAVGGSGNDRLTGNSLDNDLRGNGGHDFLIGGAGDDDLFGGDGNDTYIFRTASSAELDTVTELSGDGSDTLNFSSLTTAVNVDLSLTSTQTVHLNRQLRLNSTTGVQNVIGGTANDTLIGNFSANRLEGGAGDDVLSGSNGPDLLIGGSGNDILSGGTNSDVLIGGANSDSYVFEAASSGEIDTVTELSGEGIDRLDFSAITNNLNVNLGSSAQQSIHTNRSLKLNSGTTLEDIRGGSGNDTLRGNSLHNSITGGAGSDVMFGGDGDDQFIFATASSAELDTVTELAGDGTDTLNFSAVTSAVTLDIGTTATQSVHSNRQLKLNSTTGIQNIVGGTNHDILRGNASANVINGGAGNDILFGENGPDQLIGGEGHDTLNGGTNSDLLIGGNGDDIYQFELASSGEADIISESAYGGTDTLDFSAMTTSVNVNLGSSSTQTVHANRSLNLNSSAVIENLIGGSGNDTLRGNSLHNTIDGRAGSDLMLGGRGNDHYVFHTAASAELDTVTELAGEGTDTLDFSAIATQITVNIGLTSTQTVHTNRQLKLNSTTGIQNVIGGSDDDTITGNASANALIGNAGDDTLSGGGGRDILIGGLGLDILVGGSSDDILIAGRTLFDSKIDAVIHLQYEWISTASYAARVNALTTGTGSPAVSLEAQVNVLNDSGDNDTLTGGTGTDWYFRAVDDVITDLVAGEEIDLL